MKEGILVEQNGRIFPYDKLISALYGFNNKFGAACRIAEGGVDPTKVGENEEDRIELRIVGLTVAPEKLKHLPVNHVKYIYDILSEIDIEELLNKIEMERTENDMKGVLPIRKYNKDKKLFECLSNIELKKILRDLREMPERISKKEIEGELVLDMLKEHRDKYLEENGLEL